MQDETTPPTSPAPRSWRRWVLGCLAGLLFVCCGGPLGVLGAVSWYSGKVRGQLLDEVHARDLHGGDVEAIYRNADPEFRRAYSREMFLEFAAQLPECFRRDRLRATALSSPHVGDIEYRMVRVTVSTAAGSLTVTFYFRKVDGRLALLGIAPDLAAAVPEEVVRAAESSSGGERRGRSRLRRLFD
jgi:hypothetical protein